MTYSPVMAGERAIYMGPKLRRLRRELGLTQADMAADLEISPSYVALLERNQRPLTADMLLRIARTYRLDLADLAGDGGAEFQGRLQAVLRDPLFADIDLPPLQTADVATNYPGFAEALMRVHTAYREEQLALADRADRPAGPGEADGTVPDPVGEVRRFLTARRNSFPALDEAAEALAAEIGGAPGVVARLQERYGYRVRRLPAETLVGSVRRLDRHRRELLLSDGLDHAAAQFQLALQLAYLALGKPVSALVDEGRFAGEGGARLARRALASYAAAAILMPYAAFARAVETRRYDVEALARQFGTSFEQTAHRLTTLQKPGQERVPFFFVRIDPAGNVSKRLDGAGSPFARHGGGCPLWTIHDCFRLPDRLITQWLELPDGQRFFSIARSVTTGGGGFGAPRVERAVALGCAAEHADRLCYIQSPAAPPAPTPIGVNCTLSQRTACPARAAPPLGRQLASDDYVRVGTPFGFTEG